MELKIERERKKKKNSEKTQNTVKVQLIAGV